MTPCQLKPAIKRRLDAFDAAEAKLAEFIRAEQENCNHPVVGKTELSGEMRLCLCCGREEHAPFYHSFLFTLKDDGTRLLIPIEFDDFINSRVHTSPINDMMKAARY